MSTDISFGYRVDPGTHPFELLAQLRETMPPIYRRQYVTTLAADATSLVDQVRLGLPDLGDRGRIPAFAVGKAIEAATASERRNPFYDFTAQVLLLPDPAHPAGPWYATVHAEMRCYHAAFEALPAVTWYGWHNRTEGPQDVPEDEWLARRDTWNRLLPFGASVRSRALVWDMFTGWDQLRPKEVREDLAEAIPTDEDRAARLARLSVPSVKVLPGMRIRPLPHKQVRAAREAEQVRLLELLEPVRVDDLFSPYPPSGTA